jgi:hypothetical protein
VKVSIAFERASHVNSGTSVDPAEIPWPQTEGRVMRHSLLHLESDTRGEMTHYGGLGLAQQFVRRFRVAKRLDKSLTLFKRHFKNAIVRGDTDFDRSDVFYEAIDAGAYFAIGDRLYPPNRAALAQAIAEESWKPFVPRADRQEPSGPSRHGRTANYRRQKAKARRFRTLRTVKRG